MHRQQRRRRHRRPYGRTTSLTNHSTRGCAAAAIPHWVRVASLQCIVCPLDSLLRITLREYLPFFVYTLAASRYRPILTGLLLLVHSRASEISLDREASTQLTRRYSLFSAERPVVLLEASPRLARFSKTCPSQYSSLLLMDICQSKTLCFSALAASGTSASISSSLKRYRQ
ncbi:hypothetical protein IQ06DRAFT_102819 [Phaeosphaeriaceae sp. SRC1lsM3a]|nr:hypothetical protein IQ06DRAFT_102819 [Stagonospora sp. SRC1lsM3a]